MRTIQNPFSDPPSSDTDRLTEIYRAAARIICEKGFDGTSMNDIADAVGLTKAGLYHHISGKKDLLFRIMTYGMDSLDHEVVEPARSVGDAEERLRTIITNHVRLITSRSTSEGNNAVTIVIDEASGLTPPQRRKIDQRKRKYVHFVRETLGLLASDGKLRPVDLTTATFGLLGMILWLSRWYDPRGRLSPEAVAEEVTNAALGGLLRSD